MYHRTLITGPRTTEKITEGRRDETKTLSYIFFSSPRKKKVAECVTFFLVEGTKNSIAMKVIVSTELITEMQIN